AAAEPSVRLTLAQAVLKGDAMDGVVRDATMMGVSAIEPLVSDHTVAHMKAGHAPERWRRIAVASAKQCRRAVVPSIGAGTSLPDWASRDPSAPRLLLVEPQHKKRGQSPFFVLTPASVTLLVGPEGGWSDREIDVAIEAGYVPVTLGARTLRADA